MSLNETSDELTGPPQLEWRRRASLKPNPVELLDRRRFEYACITVDDEPDPQWMPGIVEVKFEQFATATNLFSFLAEPATGMAALWGVLKKHEVTGFKLTFPPSPEDPVPSDRRKFVTFFFQSNRPVSEIADELGQLGVVALAAPVPKLSMPSTPLNEPLLGQSDQPVNIWCHRGRCLQNQWYAFRCGVNEAWNWASGKGVVIADIDWGFDIGHPEYAPRIEWCHNTAGLTGVGNGNAIHHGTGVLGLAAAGDNDSGIVGFAFSAALWAIQAGTDGISDPAYWVRALHDVHKRNSENRRKVVIVEAQTCSLRNVESCLSINQEIKDSIEHRNMVICVAAGNGHDDAGFDHNRKPIVPTGSILVGATCFDKDDNVLSPESNFGDRVVVYAPGDKDRDVTCFPGTGNDYTNSFGGTSGATAKVAGTVALMLEMNPNLTHKQIHDILSNGKKRIKGDPSLKAGAFLDAREAVCAAIKSAGGQC